MRYHNTMKTLQRRSVSLALALLMAVSPLRANELPELGDVAGGEMSLHAERRIGQQIMNEIRQRDPSYLEDPEVQAYLAQLGARLVAASPEVGVSFTFFPINDPMINAFATFGGYVGVNTGLILAAQSESELAGVIAHEIAHVTQRHLARQIYSAKQMSIATMVAMALALLAARNNGHVASATMASAQAGNIQSQLGFSRDFEREADRVGFQTLERAGFDVNGMANFFERLQRASRVYENNAPSYLRTHPLTVERISDMQNRAQGLRYKQVADSASFHFVRAKLRAMLGTPKEAVADFQNLLKEKKTVLPAATHYGLAVALHRQKDWEGATRELAMARQLKAATPMVDRLGAEIRLSQGDQAGGLAAYREGLGRYPTSLALALGLGEALLAQRKADEGLALVQGFMARFPREIGLHKLKAQYLLMQGKMLAHHSAQAELYALQGQNVAAVQQLEQAQRAGGDFHEASQVDARLRELRRQVEDERRTQ